MDQRGLHARHGHRAMRGRPPGQPSARLDDGRPHIDTRLLQARCTELAWRHADGTAHSALASARARAHRELSAARVLLSLQDTTSPRLATRTATVRAARHDAGIRPPAVWERSIPDGKGRWDRHMFHFGCHPPTARRPSRQPRSACPRRRRQRGVPRIDARRRHLRTPLPMSRRRQRAPRALAWEVQARPTACCARPGSAGDDTRLSARRGQQGQ